MVDECKCKTRTDDKKSPRGQRKGRPGQMQETSPIINSRELNPRCTYTIKSPRVVERSGRGVNSPRAKEKKY